MAEVKICDKCLRRVEKRQTDDSRFQPAAPGSHDFWATSDQTYAKIGEVSEKLVTFKFYISGYRIEGNELVPIDLCNDCLREEISNAILNV